MTTEEEDDFWPPAKFAAEPVESEIGVVPDTGYNPFNFSAEGDYLLFRFTAETFTQVLSALRNGAFMTYGQDGERVYWEFLRNVDYPVAICASIIECLTNDADTQAALRNQLLADPDFLRDMQQNISVGNKMSPTEVTQPVGSACDRDELWAGCIGLVQQMNRNNTDFLEQIEILTNPVERITGVTRLIPALKYAEAVLDFVNELVSDIQENYAAEYTSDYENDLACELFCLALSNPEHDCAMSFEDIYNIFKNRLVASFTIESAFNDAIQYLATGTWSGTQVCDFMFMFQLQCINSASKFLAIDLLSLQQMFLVGEAEPNSGWTTLCVDCPEVPILQIYGDGAQGLNNPTQFIRYDENGYEVWQITMDAVVFAPQPVMNCADRLGRCFFIRTWDTAMHEFSGYECDGTYVPSRPAPDESLSYSVIAGIADLGTLTITVHLERDF